MTIVVQLGNMAPEPFVLFCFCNCKINTVVKFHVPSIFKRIDGKQNKPSDLISKIDL